MENRKRLISQSASSALCLLIHTQRQGESGGKNKVGGQVTEGDKKREREAPVGGFMLRSEIS